MENLGIQVCLDCLEIAVIPVSKVFENYRYTLINAVMINFVMISINLRRFQKVQKVFLVRGRGIQVLRVNVVYQVYQDFLDPMGGQVYQV